MPDREVTECWTSGHPLPNHLAERTHHQADHPVNRPVNRPADSRLLDRYRPTDRHRPNDPASTRTRLPPIAGCSTDSAQQTGIGPTNRQPARPRHDLRHGPPPGPTELADPTRETGYWTGFREFCRSGWGHPGNRHHPGRRNQRKHRTPRTNHPRGWNPLDAAHTFAPEPPGRTESPWIRLTRQRGSA